jgi:TP901 family phage tail tape measure protein
MSLPAGIRAGAAYIELTVNDAALVRGLNRAQRRLRHFGASLDAAGKRMVAASAAMLAPVGFAAKGFASFDDAMRTTAAVSGASALALEKLTRTALRLGRETSFTAVEVAAAMVELGRAGFKPAEINAAMDGVLTLARATATDLPRATEIAVNALRGFGLDVGQTARVVDVLSFAANNSSQTLDDLGESMTYVAPLAAEAGEPIESVAAALGVLANAGIKGSMAGTATARALKNLSREANQRRLKALGVDAVDAEGNLRPLASILGDLAESVGAMGSAKRLAIFETLFGRGQAAALKLAADPKTLQTLTDGMKQAEGYARRTAKAMDQGLGGSIRRMLSAAEGVGHALGGAIEKPLIRILERLREATTDLADWIDAHREAVALAVKGAVAVGAMGSALLFAGFAAKTLAFGLGATARLIQLTLLPVKLLAAGLAAVFSPIGLLTAAVVGLTAAVVGRANDMGRAMQWLRRVLEGLGRSAQASLRGIRDALMAGDIQLAAEVLWAGLKAVWYAGVAELEGVWLDLRNTMVHAWDNVVNRIARVLASVIDTVVEEWNRAIARTEAVLANRFDAQEQLAKGYRQQQKRDFDRRVGEEVGSDQAEALFRKQLAEQRERREQVAGRIGFVEHNLAEGGMGEDLGTLKKQLESLNKELAGLDKSIARNEAILAQGFKEHYLDEQFKRRAEETNKIFSKNQGRAAKAAQEAQAKLEAKRREAEKARQDQETRARARSEMAEFMEDFERDREAMAQSRAEMAEFMARYDSPQSREVQARAGDGIRAAAGAVGVRGLFNVAALQGLAGGGGLQNRIALATEETAKNTRGLNRPRSGGEFE